MVFQASLRPRGSSTRGDPGADPVNAAEHVRLLKLRAGTAELVPSARVDDDKASICILEHVGRMEVQIRAGHEVFVLGREARSRGIQHVPATLCRLK